MGALTLQVVEEEGDDLVAAVDLAVELQDVGRERVALEAEDLQFEELAHLPGQDADEVVVEEQLAQHDQLADLGRQAAQLVARHVELGEAGESADLARQTHQVVVV